MDRSGLTLREYAALIQTAIDSGEIDGDLPVAVCSYANPREEYWLLDSGTTIVEVYADLCHGRGIAIVTY